MTNVTSQAAAAQDALRDIKPPIAEPVGWAWLWLVLLGLVVIVFAIFFVRLIRLLLQERRKFRPQERVLLPHEVAQNAFDAALKFISSPRQFGIAVSDALRQYLEQRFKLRAPERTTEEFLIDLQGTTLLLPDQKETLKEFLGHCDLIKFSKHEPKENELRMLHSTASSLVDQTKDVPGPVVNIARDTQELARQKRAKHMVVAGIALQSLLILWIVVFGRVVPIIAGPFIRMFTDFSWDIRELLLTYNETLNFIFPGLPIITLIAWLAGIGGWVLLAFGMHRYRAQWFCWFLVCYSVFLVFLFPIGSAFAFFFIAYVQNHRSTFFQGVSRLEVSNS